MRIVIAAAFAASFAFTANPAIAQTEAVEVAVPVSDLDLDTTAGREALEQRIEARLREACQVRTILGNNLRQTDWDCVADGKAEAMQRLASTRGGSGSLSAN